MRLKELFLFEPSKEEVASANKHLGKVSHRYSFSAKITYMILLLIIAVFIIGNITTLSFNSFYYLTKDFSLALDYLTYGNDTISYAGGTGQSFMTYRGGLAIASRESISIISAGGNEELFESFEYGNPLIKASSKYILVYDNGGKKYSLYNSYTKVKESNTEYPLYGAALSDNGTYALITSSEDYTSVVKVVDQRGKEYNYNFTSLACGIDISNDGDKLLVAFVSGEGYTLSSEIRVYKIGKSEPLNVCKGENGVPLDISFFQNDSVSAIYSNKVLILDKKLKLKEEYKTDNKINAYSFENERAVATAPSATSLKTDIVVFDKSGNMSYNSSVPYEALSIGVLDDFVFIQTPSELVRINMKSQKISEIIYPASSAEMIVIDAETVLMAFDTHARYIKFN